jgi:hypothetical protein
VLRQNSRALTRNVGVQTWGKSLGGRLLDVKSIGAVVSMSILSLDPVENTTVVGQTATQKPKGFPLDPVRPPTESGYLRNTMRDAVFCTLA